MPSFAAQTHSPRHQYGALLLLLAAALLALAGCSDSTEPAAEEDPEVFPVTDTGQTQAWDAAGAPVDPQPGDPLWGQDAHREGALSVWTDAGDGAVRDATTELMWTAAPLFAGGRSREDCLDAVDALELGGHDDWRLPSVKELFSLVRYTGTGPYLDTAVFTLDLPDTAWGLGDRPALFLTRDLAVDALGNSRGLVFCIDFLEGRVRAHPYAGDESFFRVLAVRADDNFLYGWNNFEDNEDGTLTDLSTGLMWQQVTERVVMDWDDALAYAAGLELAGYDDWVLPDVKELHSLVDYSLAAPVLDERFGVPDDDGWYWTSTTAPDDPSQAFYVAFGPAVSYRDVDTHGPGAVRSDPKTGDPQDWLAGQGAERDQVRLLNFVRCVRKTD